MFSLQTADLIKEAVDLSTFIGIVVARAVNTITKVKGTDLSVKGQYTARVIRKIEKALNCNKEEAENYLRLSMGVNDYETRRSMQGVGGCTPISLEQALKEATL